MQLSQATDSPNTIRQYADDAVTLHDTTYRSPILLTPKKVFSFDDRWLDTLFAEEPDIILIAGSHTAPEVTRVTKMLAENQRTAEVMTLGAACRTFNVLLSEKRRVLAILFIGI